MIKRFFKEALTKKLSWYVRRLHKKHIFKTVVVTGSVGKTSTKYVIAQYLAADYRVQYQAGNYNDLLSVPFVYFGLPFPALYNPLAWLRAFWQMELLLRRPYPYDVVVLELGTDGPGQIASFARYVHADVSVVTAVAAEHMDSFKTIEAVAKEELSVAKFSRNVIINLDDISQEYIRGFPLAMTYGTSPEAQVRLESSDNGSVVIIKNKHRIEAKTALVGVHLQKTLAAAIAVSNVLDFQVSHPSQVIAGITPMPGRMQRIKGINSTTILDDTYNASPEAVIAALNVLYKEKAKYRIAVLGNMNEMGGYAKQAHESVAAYCDASKFDEIIVIGPDASRYLVPPAKQRGNQVRVFDSPYKIGDYLKRHAPKGSVILFKGSQNGVYLEEAIKPLLANPRDEALLVRQSPAWLKKKHAQFKRVS